MAWNNNGTVAVAQGDRTVLGTGTNWIKQREGWWLWLRGEARPHEIAAVVSSTQITLVEAVEMATASGVDYAIIPTQGLNQNLVEKIDSLIDRFSNASDAWDLVFTSFSGTTYQLWLDQGNAGSVSDFLGTLVGATGADAYQVWLNDGNAGTLADYYAFLKGEQGDSAYQVWLDAGNTGTVQDYHNDLSQGAVAATAANVTAAEQAVTDAQAEVTLAKDEVALANAARVLASKWASEDEDTEISSGLFSALHHAAKAAISASAASGILSSVQAVQGAIETVFDNFDDRYLGNFDTANQPETDNDGDPIQIGAMYLNTDEDELRFWNGAQWKSPEATAEAAAAAALASQTAAAGSASAASTSEGNAAQSETKASQWAGAAEDTEVEPGLYSAKHFAAKADAAADAASIASNATGWVAKTSPDEWIKGTLVWSPINLKTYRALLTHTDQTDDPSVDATHWVEALGFQSGAGSGLDADLLDGRESTDFADADHNHDNVYATPSRAIAFSIIFGS